MTPPEPHSHDRPACSHPLRVAELPARKSTRLRLAPDAPARAAIARALGVSAVRELAFTAEISAVGAQDWRLEGTLKAKVVQPCVVTLEPVVTRIHETVLRRYLTNPGPAPDALELEVPEDDSSEPLTQVIDVGMVMLEALALALPDYPRATDSHLGDAVFAAPGVAPLRDEDIRPFAGLAGLHDKLKK